MKTNLVKIDTEQGLYILSADGKYFSCLGFEVCEKRTRALATELHVHLTDRKPGTAAHYKTYCALVKMAGKLNKVSGWRSKSELNQKLIGLEGKRIEAILYGEKTRFIVGKSTGFIPCHLQIHNSRSTGGPAITSDPESIEVIKIIT